MTLAINYLSSILPVIVLFPDIASSVVLFHNIVYHPISQYLRTTCLVDVQP